MSTSRPPKAGTKTRAYHHGSLRDALLDEGLAALEEGERAEVSLRELARRVGVSPNAAYRHFTDKDALLTAMAAEGFRRFAEAAGASQREPAGAAASLRAYGRAYVAFARKYPALFRLMFGRFTASERSEELTKAGALTFDALRAGVAALSGFPLDDPRTSVGALYSWSLVHGLSHLILDGQIEGDPDEMTDAVLGLASRAGPRP